MAAGAVIAGPADAPLVVLIHGLGDRTTHGTACLR